MRIPATTLNNGTELPLLGLGTYKLVGAEAETIVRTAIELGYTGLYKDEYRDNRIYGRFSVRF